MGRLLVALIGFAAIARPDTRKGSPDPLFDTIPFDRWFDGGEQARFKWTSRVFPMGLTNHQRLGARVQVELDGVELVKRRGKGEIVVLVQFEDKNGQFYRAHRSLPLEDVKDEARRSIVQFRQDAFVAPGDYQVSLAVFATTTGEHAVARRTLHIDPLPRDPLPDIWRDLPAVEFLTVEDPPDTWWVPATVGRLNLPLETKRPVHIELLVNESTRTINRVAL